MAVDTKKSPLVILGFDVGDARYIEKWAKEGYLPNIASVMNRGCSGRLGGPELICEYGSALSLFSGISRGQHGYYYSRQINQGTYDLKPFVTRDTGALPFWSHLRGKDKKVAVLDAPDCDLVPGLPGFQLVEWATHESLYPMASEPANVLEEVVQKFGERMKVDEDYECNFQEEIEIYSRLLQRVKKKGELFRERIKEGNFDLVVATFYEMHTASHQFWKYLREGEEGKDEHQLTHAIRNVYQAVDEQFGLILGELPPESNIFIYSLFGMQDQHPTTGLTDAFCRQFASQAPPPLSLNPMSLIRRLLPESLRVKLSHYLPRHIQERLLASQLKTGMNWGKTSAFSISSLYTGFVRVNLKGREPQGIVNPGAEYNALLDQFVSDLKALVDVKTGLPAVTKVLKTVDIYQVDPLKTSLPDLFIEWQPGSHFMDKVSHPRTVITQQRPPFDPGSEERLEGFLAAAGPSIQTRGAIGEVSLLDLAPTFLSALGESAPSSMKGKALWSMVPTL